MIPFHSILPEIAQREVRCLYVGPAPDASPGIGLAAGEYAFVEFYCDDLQCDCRRAFLQVLAQHDQHTVFASINCGWEKESFYRKKISWPPDAAQLIVRGSLDPLQEQSDYAEELLAIFQQYVWDAPYRLRLRRHYRLFREELARRPDRPS